MNRDHPVDSTTKIRKNTKESSEVSIEETWYYLRYGKNPPGTVCEEIKRVQIISDNDHNNNNNNIKTDHRIMTKRPEIVLI